jgi:hypothetical protein
MKLSKIALALTVMAAGTAAVAAPNANRIGIIAGASASTGNLLLALTNLCASAGGTATSLGSGNFRALVCANSAVTEGAGGTYVSKPNAQFINFNGTSYAEVRINTEGSFSAVLLLNGAALNVRDPAAGAASSVYPAGSVKVGGLLDIEPTAFPATTIGANTLFPSTPAGVAQTFGIAASDTLYTAMFNQQQADGLIPGSCTVGNTTLPYCVPSISTAQMATILADNDFNAAYSNGVGFLVPALAGTELRYVRRVNESGTQASAQNFILGLPCSKNGLSIVSQPVGDDEPGGLRDELRNAIRVLAAPGTGDVRTELNKAGLYALGVVSGENNQSGQSWKWLRLNGVAMAENAAPGSAGVTNTATMRNGTYSFFYETVYMGGSTAGNAFWATVSSALNSLASPVGLVEKSVLEAGYNRAGLACQFPASN